MDMVDILGGLLRKKSGAATGGGGGNILKDILTGGGRASAPRSSGAAPGLPSGGVSIEPPRSAKNDQEFSSLDDFLHNAHRGSRPAASPSRPSAPATRPTAPTPPVSRPSSGPLAPTGHIQRPPSKPSIPQITPGDANARAEVLVRAMINAAKADGQIDQAEQDAIVKQCGDLTQDDVRWLQSEFATPLNVPEFAWSVPIGMEREVYAISLMAMNLDNNAEAMYLKDLAHGFRMTLANCNAIHQQYGAPQMR